MLRGQEHLDIEPADSVLVVGAGPIGILHVMLARMNGAAKITIADRWPERLALAERLGADEPSMFVGGTSPRPRARYAGGRGFDVIIVAAPSLEADAAALDLAAPGGRINWFAGLPKTELDRRDRHQHRALQGTPRDRHDSVLDIRLPARRRTREFRGLDVLPLVTRVRPLAEAPNEFAGAKDHASMKTVLTLRVP